MQPPGLNIFSSQPYPENARSCRRDRACASPLEEYVLRVGADSQPAHDGIMKRGRLATVAPGPIGAPSDGDSAATGFGSYLAGIRT